VRILQALKREVLCVGALADRLGISQSAVSQHLRVLRQAGAVSSEKRGYYVHYRVNGQKLREWRRVLDGLFEPAEGAAGQCDRRGCTEDDGDE
jgi:DNA-binding transcriptional ArsR family regulator